MSKNGPLIKLKSENERFSTGTTQQLFVKTA